MQILGLNKLTLLDYPGHVAATLFTGGCNFCCPFCHNGDLVLRPGSVSPYEETAVFSFLKKRQGLLDGVCITGGEPTLQKDLMEYIEKIKDLGYLVKLDTNGYKPEILKELCNCNLVDYVAMDIKSGTSSYPLVAGKKDLNIENIQTSVTYLMNQTIPYEFRTTLIQEFHTQSSIREIGELIKGCQNYYLQSYKETDCVIEKGFHSIDKETMQNYVLLLKDYQVNASLRGID